MKTATTSFLLFTMLLGFAPEANSSTLIYALTSGALLYRSTDGAKSWARIVIDGEPASSANPALAVDPQNPSILYVAVEAAGKGSATGGTAHNFDPPMAAPRGLKAIGPPPPAILLYALPSIRHPQTLSIWDRPAAAFSAAPIPLKPGARLPSPNRLPQSAQMPTSRV